MKNVLTILQQLAATSSTNAKKQLLEDNKDNELLQQVMVYAYSPKYKYYIKKIPEYTSTGIVTYKEMFNTLDLLRTREVTGHAAIALLTETLTNLYREEAELLENIIKGDLRCGINASTINKVWKKLIPDPAYMRCSLPKQVKLNKWPFDKGVYQQIKADGSFAKFNNAATGVSLETRAGTEYPLEPFAALIEEATKFLAVDTQTHGELLVVRNGAVLPREIGNGILNSAAKGGSFGPGERPVFAIWDQIPLANALSGETYKVRYADRFYSIVQQCGLATRQMHVIETNVMSSIEEVIKQFSIHLKAGLEGSIIKHPDGFWEDTTSKNQVKLKLEAEVDLEIVDFNPGNGKNAATFGSIKCKSSDDNLVVNISGFSDAMRAKIFKEKDQLIGSIVTVKGNTLMPPTSSNDKYSIFLPRFVEFRTDKNVADSIERISAEFENAITAIRKQFEC